MEILADLLAALATFDNPHRLRVLAALHEARLHVSELARRLGISRPLLYMHLKKPKAKHLEREPFDIRMTPARIAALEKG